MQHNIQSSTISFSFDECNLIKSQSKIADVFVGTSNYGKILIKRFKTHANNNDKSFYKLETENSVNKIYFKSQNCELIHSENQSYLIRPFIEGQQIDIFFKGFKGNKHKRIVFLINLWIKVLHELSRIHSHNILHRDIKPSNIIVSFKEEINDSNFENIDVNIIDFGQSNFIENQIHENRIPFTLLYSPPEQVLNLHNICGFYSDIYSLGLTMYELITKEPPFQHRNPELLMNLMISQPLDYEKVKNVELRKLILKSCYKTSLGKPPSYFQKSELIDFLHNDISKRHQTCEQLIDDLENLKLSNSKINPDFRHYLKRIFQA